MIYLFTCENTQCNYYEKFHLPVDKRNDVKICPLCHSNMSRQISKPGFVFKGEGFYESIKKNLVCYLSDLKFKCVILSKCYLLALDRQ